MNGQNDFNDVYFYVLFIFPVSKFIIKRNPNSSLLSLQMWLKKYSFIVMNANFQGLFLF